MEERPPESRPAVPVTSKGHQTPRRHREEPSLGALRLKITAALFAFPPRKREEVATSVFDPKMRRETRFSVASPSQLRLCNAPRLHRLRLGLKLNIAALLSECGLCE